MNHSSEASESLCRRARALSLKWKIPLVIGLLVLLSVAICYVEFRHWHSKQYERMTRMEAEVVITMVQNAFELKMAEGALHDAVGLLEALAVLDSVHHIRIFDPSGNIWLSGRPEERGASVSPAEMRSFREGMTSSLEASAEHGDRRVTFVTEEIPLRAYCKSCHHTPGGVPASLQLNGDQAYYWTITRDGREQQIGGILSFGVYSSGLAEVTSIESSILARDFLLVSLVFGVSLPVVLGLLVTRRIVGLARKMRDACNGNLAVRAPSLPADEIGDLGLSFNQLLTNLDEARSQLEEVHRQQLYHMERLSTVGELAVRVAHEIKNPIAGLASGVDLLQQADLPDEQKQAAAREMRHQIQRLDRVTRNLLDFSRSRPVEHASCSLAEVAEHVRQFMDTESRKEPFQVVVKADEDLPEIQGDAKLLEQALLNLVLNAKQAGARTVRIQCCCCEVKRLCAESEQTSQFWIRHLGSRGVVVHVVDDGPGIPEAQLKDIWKPFYTTKPEGTGLGLSIVRQIIVGHGGEVLVESVTGQGAVFTLYFPLQNDIKEGTHETKHSGG